MWGLSRSTRVFVREGATDLRLGFEGLFALVEQQLRQDPLSGHLFVFCNRQRTRMKILTWDGSGLWLCTKRLEQGTFARAEHGEIDAAGFQALIGGLEVKGRRKWFRR
jgi:transposase